jgi:hypothetical protein
MGYYFALGHCIACGQPFTFNPDRVPSLVVNGVREPVCKSCVDRVNPIRKAKGLPEIVPLPGAYAPGPEDDDSFDPFHDEEGD